VDNSLTKTICPGCPEAVYKPQRLPQFKGNKLIEALPLVLTNDQLFEHLNVLPQFELEQQNWSSEERLHMLLTLSSFMIVLSRHIVLARSLDSMLRAGYVGRVPRTPEHAQRLQRTYELQTTGGQSAEGILASNPQLSTLLMGVSGMGKTSVTKRFAHAASNFPP
jgi:predicted AAA+ superfamily ATPase